MFSQVQATTESPASAQSLDGARIANEIKREVAAEVEGLSREHAVVPCLAAVRVGDDPASAVYVRNKIRACEEIGIRSELHALPETTSAEELLRLLATLNT